MTPVPPLRELARKLESAHPGGPALVVALMAGAYRLWIVAHHGGDTYGGAMVKGMPYTDAYGWYMMALEFARGERWSTLWAADVWGPIRPFYYLFIGSIFTLTGPAVAVVRGVHIVLGTLSAILVFDLLRRIGPVWVALVAAVAHAFSREDAMQSLSTMTETLGSFLTNVWLWTFVVGVQKLARAKAAPVRASWPLARPFLASGVALGLANLTRPLNLLAAVPFVALLPVVFLGERARLRGPLLAASGLFLLGVTVVVGPWILRQRMTYGITTLSFNSAEALFAATAPRFGTWTPEVSALTRGLPVEEKATFYNEGTRRHLRRHWQWYIGNAWSHLGTAAAGLQPSRALLAAGCALLLSCSVIGFGTKEGLGPLIAVGMTLAAIGLPDRFLCLTWVAASLAALWARHPIVFLAAALASTVGPLGALALPAPRFTYSLEWAAVAVALWMVSWCLDRRVGDHATPWADRLPSAPNWGREGRWASSLARAASLLFVAALSIAVLRNVAAARPAPPVALPARTAAAWEERMWPGLAAYDALREDVTLIRVQLMPDYQIRLHAGERLDHWSPVFDARPYDSTLVALRPSLGTPFAVYAGALPEEVASNPGDVVLLGLPVLYSDGEQTLEVIASGIGDPTLPTARVACPDPAIQAAHVDRLLGLARQGRSDGAVTPPR